MRIAEQKSMIWHEAQMSRDLYSRTKRKWPRKYLQGNPNFDQNHEIVTRVLSMG